ncbi:MAG: sulfatase-like hydrolase/transferase [Paracoccaceae bacterium]
MVRVAFAFGFICILLPLLRAYALNIQSFQIDFSSFFFVALAISAGSAGLLWIFMRVAKERFRAFAILAALFSILLVWFFLNFKPGGIGFLDGREIHFEDIKWDLVFETWIVLALAMTLFAFRNHALAYAGTLSVAACMWSFAAVIPTFWVLANAANDDEVTYPRYLNNQDSHLYSFSRTNNIILFVLDTFQTDAAKKVLVNDPELAHRFRDFTFFQNTVATFSKTYMSVPAMLTGKSYDNGVTVQDFLHSAYFQSESLPLRLQSEGYDTRAYAYASSPQIKSPLLWDNLLRVGTLGYGSAEEFTRIARVALISIAPTFFKVLLANDILFHHVLSRIAYSGLAGQETTCDSSLSEFETKNDVKVTITGDAIMFGKLINCSSVEIERPVFRLFHMQGAHEPFYISKAETTPLQDQVDDAYAIQVEGSLSIMAAVLDRLRRIDVYSNATILIASDHGAHEYGENYDREVFGLEDAEPERDVSDYVISASLATLMFKPSNSYQEKMPFSNAPLTLIDVAPTLISAAELPTTRPTITDFSEDSDRIRHHSFYKFKGWQIDYIEDLTRYSIQGPVWDPASWSKGQELLPP